jgi:hypothetical protein
MNVASINRTYVSKFLTFLGNRIKIVTDANVLSDLFYSLSELRLAMEEHSDSLGPALERQETNSNGFSPESDPDSAAAITDKIAKEDIRKNCTKLLLLLAGNIRSGICDMKAVNLQKVLTVLCSMPLKDDHLIGEIELEIVQRIKVLQDFDRENLEELLGTAASILSSMKRKGGSSSLYQIKNGLRSVLGMPSPLNCDEVKGSDLSLRVPEESNSIPRQLENAMDCIAAAYEKIEKTERICQVSVHDEIISCKRGMLFQLGRCLESIEQYRRIDFASGLQRSRLDENRRRTLTKRPLSRQLP